MARPRKDGPQHDWPAIYADWLTGEYSNAQLARKHGLAPSSVNQKIAREKWTTTSGPVANPVSIMDDEPTTPAEPKRKPVKTKPAKVNELLKQSTEIVQRLIAEVDNVTTYQDEIRDIIEIEETDPIRRRAAMKAISVTERTKTMKELVATLRMIQPAKVGRPKKDEDAVADEPKGKKAQRQAEAEKIVGGGRFAPRSGPKLVVNG